jgi:hypothetical protein
LTAALVLATRAGAETYYVRQRAGNDAHDGRSAATAWQSVGKLAAVMGPGDVGYVGPGLYREEIEVVRSGTADRPITLVADDKGRQTGDPPGIVMLAGSEPVDEAIFRPADAPGVFTAAMPAWTVRGVVEMDGPQVPYLDVRDRPIAGLGPTDVVERVRSSFFYDEATRLLRVHTSDDRAPAAHELELIRREHGIAVRGEHVAIVGFTIRHARNAGIAFGPEAHHGTVVGTVSYGNRDGVRIDGARDSLLYASVLFRNEDAGAAFGAGATNGRAIAVTSYENRHGLRWTTAAHGAVAVDGSLFDNTESGLALEDVSGAVMRWNRLVANGTSQLRVHRTRYASDENCIDAAKLAADVATIDDESYRTLGAYREARAQDRRSREGRCGTLPAKIHAHRLHVRTLTASANEARPRGVRAWLRGLWEEARAGRGGGQGGR